MNDGDPRKIESLQSLSSHCCEEFTRCYDARPDWIAAAPGRVNLIGEHTDYNDGFVLPMAIERYVVLAGRKVTANGAHRARIRSHSVADVVDVAYHPRPSSGPPSWANYARGVVAGFLGRGISLPCIDSLMVSNVPLGGGLSSSAAVEVATATLLELACDVALDPYEKAKLCRRAEHEFAGVPCGIMDQLISILGDPRGPLLIDCRSEAARVVPFVDSGACFLIANTNVRHSLASGEYSIRRAQCSEAARKLGVNSLRDASADLLNSKASHLSELEFRRARHVITENERTIAAADALERRDLDCVGRLMIESHTSLRDDFEVSCAELDILVDLALASRDSHGVFGARMTGGGFGGCIVALVRSESVQDLRARLDCDYKKKVGRAIDGFVSRPARGAHPLTIARQIQ